MKTARKILTMALVLALCAVNLAVPAFAEGWTLTAPGTFPVVEGERAEIDILAPMSTLVEDIETNWFTTMYEEKTNVHVNWELSADLTNTKAMVFASGDYPDVFFGGISVVEEMSYANTIFIPLNDLIEEQTVWMKDVLYGDLKYVIPAITQPDGNIYVLPTTTYEDSHLICQNRYWINTYWLNQLGLAAPTTTDELYEVLKAFKEKDPNGNGLADEIPIVLTSPFTCAYLTSAFIYDDGQNRFRILEDGVTVDPIFNKEEWREGIRFIKKLYDEGLTDPTAFTLDSAATKELFENATAETVGSISGMYQGNWANIDGERQAHMDALPPVAGPEGVQYAGYYPYVHTGVNARGSAAISTQCESPELVMRWLDWFFDFEGGLTVRTGPKGVKWDVPPEGSKSYTGEPATWTRLTSFGLEGNDSWQGMGMPHSHSMHSGLLGHADKFYEADGLEDRLIYYTRQYQEFIPEKVLPQMYVAQDISDDYYRMQTDINNFVDEAFVQFVTGGMSIENDWDAYVGQLNSMGLEQYIAWTQETYNGFLAATAE